MAVSDPLPAAKSKVTVVQAEISGAAAAEVKVNAPETIMISSRLPLFRRTTSQPGLL